ncbi:MAG: hypothetical protein AAFY31_03690, partial [Pseudomonadota bacterium]
RTREPTLDQIPEHLTPNTILAIAGAEHGNATRVKHWVQWVKVRCHVSSYKLIEINVLKEFLEVLLTLFVLLETRFVRQSHAEAPHRWVYPGRAGYACLARPILSDLILVLKIRSSSRARNSARTD